MYRQAVYGVSMATALVTGVVILVPEGRAGASHEQGANSGVLRGTNWKICASVGSGDSNTGVNHGISQVNRSEVNGRRSCDTGANVFINRQYLADSFYGSTSCTSGFRNGGCDIKLTTLNSRTITTLGQWKKTATHELGHVAGLGHRYTNGSAMTQGSSPPISEDLDTHDLGAINSTYPF